ncbi:hypothetical protein M3664_04580 [Paenibacillus lautus]|uniref:hypothetical protein n=1 Tax=Paenibacillus lautus TaxID=1401 RepID=UPI002041C1CA|nr:hypothetical protein [Paenibacillus lautus]MCM3257057.1 hypothetical protein [Paenibacillus lautus]
MKSIVGKWMYNTGSEEHWSCQSGEFDTREQAIEEGVKYFKDQDDYGYAYHEGESFEGDSFDIGQISEPEIYLEPHRIIDYVIEQVGEQCGEVSDRWLGKVSVGEVNILGDMLTATFKDWLNQTNNKPDFYAIKYISSIKL